MHYFYLMDPFRAYLRFPVSISMVLGYFSWDNNLIDIYKVVILYQGAGFGVKYNILLYHLLITFIYALRAFSKSIPIKKVCSSGLRDLIRLLTSIKLFQPISFA